MLLFIIILIIAFFIGYSFFMWLFSGFSSENRHKKTSKDTYITNNYYDNRSVTIQQKENQESLN